MSRSSPAADAAAGPAVSATVTQARNPPDNATAGAAARVGGRHCSEITPAHPSHPGGVFPWVLAQASGPQAGTEQHPRVRWAPPFPPCPPSPLDPPWAIPGPSGLAVFESGDAVGDFLARGVESFPAQHLDPFARFQV